MIGTVLCKRYRIMEEIGHGGMGVVYRAWDESLQTNVALKVLLPVDLKDPSARDRFKRGALLPAPIDHPNVCSVRHFDTCDGVDCLVMDYIAGTPLEERIAAGLRETEVLDLGRQLLAGLAKAHDLGVIHRDLKPGNIKVTHDGFLKIFDFGLAKFFKAKANRITGQKITTSTINSATESAGAVRTLSAPHTVWGTLPYMAPEALSGAEQDMRCDVYSAGVVLYEMATGRRPFPQPGEEELVYAILNTPPPRPRALHPGLSRKLERVILKTLEKDPGRRYQSARELLEDLSLDPEEKSWLPWAAVLSGASLLAALYATDLAGVQGLVTSWFRHPARHATIAVLEFSNRSGDRHYDAVAAGITRLLWDQLAQIQAFDVISPVAVAALQSRNMAPSEMSRKLSANVFVEGTVILTGDSLRISASLSGPPQWRATWSHTYQEPSRSWNSVAGDMSGRIRAFLEPSEKAVPAKVPAVDPQAFKLYVEALYLVNGGQPEKLERAADLFQRSITLDSMYAPAQAGLANALYLLVGEGLVPRDQGIPAAKEAAKRALTLDHDLAEAHTVLGSILEDHEWKWRAAEKEFRLAIRLTPSDATAHTRYAELLTALGRFDEAIPQIERLVKLDPFMVQEYGSILMAQGKYPEAIEQYRIAASLDPPVSRLASIYSNLGFAYWKADSAERAMDAFVRSWQAGGVGESTLDDLRKAYAKRGLKGVWSAQLALLEQGNTSPDDVYPLAALNALVGRRQRAFELLKESCERRESYLVGLNVDTRLDDLRSDSRFEAIRNCVGLPPRP